jgi:hypothetical protein
VARVVILYAEWEQARPVADACRALGHLSVAIKAEQALSKGVPLGFDLAVLSLESPTRVLEALRAAAPELPVIGIVTYLGDEEAAGLRRGGVKTILFRPYGPQTLSRAIAEELRWSARRPPRPDLGGLQAP